MFVASKFIEALANVLESILDIYFLIVIIRVLLSWVNPDPYNPIVQILYRLTEPVLSRARRIIPPISGLDLSPIVVLLAIQFLKIAVIDSLHVLAHRMG